MNKVISMVPSWTETLLECGVNVVGRTRFCIHPDEKVKSIAIVGGTKDINWHKVNSLNADFIVLDKEENIKDWKNQSPLKNLITHVQDVKSLVYDLQYLSKELQNPTLFQLSEKWQQLKIESKTPLEKMPGFIKWLRKERFEYTHRVYIIWRNPWIAASKETFIGSLFQLYGHTLWTPSTAEKYPRLDDLKFPNDTLLLFSTEPFPFHKNSTDLLDLPYDSALIDGEAFSWFGIRSYRFLTHDWKD